MDYLRTTIKHDTYLNRNRYIQSCIWWSMER